MISRLPVTAHARLFSTLCSVFFSACLLNANVSDDTRLKMRQLLMGTDQYTIDQSTGKATDATIQSKIDATDAAISSSPSSQPFISGTGYWDLLITNSNRTYLWKAFPFSDPVGNPKGYTANMTASYGRLLTMLTATYTPGSAFYNNTALRGDVFDALDWLNSTKYGASTTVVSGDWFDYNIGTPKNLVKLMIVAYDQLSDNQLGAYAAAIDRFVPTPQSKGVLSTAPTMTGSNLVNQAFSVALRGIIVGGTRLADAQGSAKVKSASDALWIFDANTNPNPVLDYRPDNSSRSNRDGFYTDGSFIQHYDTAYIGGYGSLLLPDIGQLLYAFAGTTWDISVADRANAYRWIFDSVEPFIYNGKVLDAVRGRSIGGGPSFGPKSATPALGVSLINAIYYVSLTAPDSYDLGANYPSDPKPAMYRMLKYWLGIDSTNQILKGSPIYNYVQLKAIKDSSAITPRGELLTFQLFSNQDRVVQLRPGYGFELSLSSKRTNKWESGWGQNKRGWYVSDGMVYLYNSDLSKYQDFWQTVDTYRLPGTTVDTQSRTEARNWSNYVADSAVISGATSITWVGGTSLTDMNTADGFYGTVGMDHKAPGDILTGNNPSGQANISTASKGIIGTVSNLTAKKSWFFFDDEMVSLGAGITTTGQSGVGRDGTTARRVETIVENHKLNGTGSNTLTVDGTATSLSWTSNTSLSGTDWVHLQGTASGETSSVGYYFPGGANLTARREARTGDFTMVDAGYPTTFSTLVSADTYYQSQNSPVNHGTSATIDVKNDSGQFYREGYVKIDLTNFIKDNNVTLDTATLSLVVANKGNATNITHAAEYISDNSWTETGLTGALSSTSTALTSWTVPAINGVVNIDISNLVKTKIAAGIRVLTLRIYPTSGIDTNSFVSYASKENSNVEIQPVVTVTNYKEPTTSNFATLWIDHGVNPSNAEYRYVTLPGKSASEVGQYASQPDIKVLENTASLQAVQERTLGVIGANFWNDASTTLQVDGQNFITVDKKCSIMTQETADLLRVEISDPTQSNTGVINVAIPRSRPATGSVVTADAGITVESPPTSTLNFTVDPDADGNLGRSRLLIVKTTPSATFNATADAFVRDGNTYHLSNFGSDVLLTVKSDGTGYRRKSYVSFDVSGYSGTVRKAIITLYPVGVPTVPTINQAHLVTSSWVENTINWDNIPTNDAAALAHWVVPALNKPVSIDVTKAVQDAVAGTTGKIVSIVISSLTTDTNATTSYGSRENTSSNYRPKLTIK
jgi:hyaluronate lyase